MLQLTRCTYSSRGARSRDSSASEQDGMPIEAICFKCAEARGPIVLSEPLGEENSLERLVEQHQQHREPAPQRLQAHEHEDVDMGEAQDQVAPLPAVDMPTSVPAPAHAPEPLPELPAAMEAPATPTASAPKRAPTKPSTPTQASSKSSAHAKAAAQLAAADFLRDDDVIEEPSTPSRRTRSASRRARAENEPATPRRKRARSRQ
jgi:hypothetical protein